jgi:hypothetical protein
MVLENLPNCLCQVHYWGCPIPPLSFIFLKANGSFLATPVTMQGGAASPAQNTLVPSPWKK